MRYLIEKLNLIYEEDISLVRKKASIICESIGISIIQKSRFITAISEMLRTLFKLLSSVEISFEYVEDRSKGILSSVLKTNNIKNKSQIIEIDKLIKNEVKKLVEIININMNDPNSITILLGTYLPSGDSQMLKKVLNIREELHRRGPSSSYEMIRAHNEELLQLLEELRKKDELLAKKIEELEEMNRELDRTNRGIIALTHELENKNKELEEKNSELLKEIIEREKTEKRLKESEERYRILVENITDGILVVKNGTILFTNRQAKDILGYNSEDLTGTDIINFFPDQMREKLIRIIESESEECSEKACETKIITKEGEEIDVEVVVRNIVFSNEIAHLFILRDIRLRKLLEIERFHTRKLESMGILAGGIAHDFNNLLTIIMGNLAIAKTKLGEKSDIYKFIEEAENASHKVKDLIYEFLEFSSGKLSETRERINIRETLKTTVELVFKKQSIEKSISVQDDLWEIEGSLYQIKRALTNILANAKEAMKDRGKLVVTAENINLENDQFPPLKAGKWVKITITDTGCGIPEKHIDKIFDPYFSTKERATKKGMGLGLTIAYSIIKSHGGKIFVYSEEGKGTEVEIYLPAKTK